MSVGVIRGYFSTAKCIEYLPIICGIETAIGIGKDPL